MLSLKCIIKMSVHSVYCDSVGAVLFISICCYFAILCVKRALLRGTNNLHVTTSFSSDPSSYDEIYKWQNTSVWPKKTIKRLGLSILRLMRTYHKAKQNLSPKQSQKLFQRRGNRKGFEINLNPAGFKPATLQNKVKCSTTCDTQLPLQPKQLNPFTHAATSIADSNVRYTQGINSTQYASDS